LVERVPAQLFQTPRDRNRRGHRSEGRGVSSLGASVVGRSTIVDLPARSARRTDETLSSRCRRSAAARLVGILAAMRSRQVGQVVGKRSRTGETAHDYGDVGGWLLRHWLVRCKKGLLVNKRPLVRGHSRPNSPLNCSANSAGWRRSLGWADAALCPPRRRSGLAADHVSAEIAQLLDGGEVLCMKEQNVCAFSERAGRLRKYDFRTPLCVAP
jgi:hypothetical protein